MATPTIGFFDAETRRSELVARAEQCVEVMPDANKPVSADLEFAQLHNVTPLDVKFLGFALQQKSPLATRDDALAEAAVRAGVLVHRWLVNR